MQNNEVENYQLFNSNYVKNSTHCFIKMHSIYNITGTFDCQQHFYRVLELELQIV